MTSSPGSAGRTTALAPVTRGTLDPFATGLLLVLLGRATRAQQFLMGLPKSYETVAQLGATSTTGDPEGEIVETGRVPADPPALPTGVLRQVPPAYSAIKIDGERAYARARRGEQVEMPERQVTVTRFEQLWRRDDRAAFAIDCSSGTYIRSLILDLGDAYCVELRRTSIGPFEVADADPERIVPLGDVLARVMPIAPSRRAAGQAGRSRSGGPGRGARRGRPRAARGRQRSHRGRTAARRRPPQAHRRLPGMKVTPLPEIQARPRRVAVGTFDGVHRGHREVIAGADTVLTFDPHPSSVVAPGAAPKLLTTLRRKAELIESLGVQELVVIPFDADFASRSAQSFVDDVLVERSGRHARLRRRELPLRAQGAGRHERS